MGTSAAGPKEALFFDTRKGGCRQMKQQPPFQVDLLQ